MFSTAGRSSSAISAWLWPSRARWPASIFPGVHVRNDPYPVWFGSGDWITGVTRTTGTFTGEVALPGGTVIPPMGKAFDLDFGQTSKWQGDQLIAISAFWDALRVTWSL